MSKISKIFILVGLKMVIYCSDIYSAKNVDNLSYESLAANPYTDHVQIFKELFSAVKIHSFLEFGVGYGTKYFLDHCEEVTSCEILIPSQTADWFKHTLEIFQKYSNWTPILKYGSLALQEANVISGQHGKDPALYDASYMIELKDICDDLFKDKKFDVAFVDPGFHMRADLVNELFDRVPIIAAHDTNRGHNQYGWGKIYTPHNYEKITFNRGMGLTLWIRKDKSNLLSALKGQPKNLNIDTKPLRIFFPVIHPALVKSMALALQYLGHTLVLPGESFNPASPMPGHKISLGYVSKASLLNNHLIASSLLQQIEVIENNEILSNPPDVFFINCPEIESNIYSIVDALQKIAHQKTLPKVAHFSGNNGTRYSTRTIKNLIAVDAYSSQYYNPSTTNIVFWIPWIDFKENEFTGVSDGLIVNSYISHYYNVFLKSAACFDSIINQCRKDFQNISFNAYPHSAPSLYSSIPHTEVLSLMDNSCATIHIKESEGFGYTIIESLSKGRPVFLKRSFSLGSRLMNWCIEGKTAFFFDDYNEFFMKLQSYTYDKEHMHQVQKECASTVRKLINNEKQARILENFLQNLK